MQIKHSIVLILILTLFSCGGKESEQKISANNESRSNNDLEKSWLEFAKMVLEEKLSVNFHERKEIGYREIQMIFEADDYKSDHFNSYTSYSNKQLSDDPIAGDEELVILYVVTYKDVESADHAYQQIKSNSEIRIAELEGFAGLIVEQAQIFERIRRSGGMFVQKEKYVFFLVKSCNEPPVGQNWCDFENLFLTYITEANEEIEVFNADCHKDIFIVQNRIASR